MFPASLISDARKLISAENKAYVVSDNSIVVIPREQSLDNLKAHCKENDLKILDVEAGIEIEVTEKKNKKSDK